MGPPFNIVGTQRPSASIMYEEPQAQYPKKTQHLESIKPPCWTGILSAIFKVSPTYVVDRKRLLQHLEGISLLAE